MSLLIKGLKMPKKEDELLCIRIYPSGKVTIDMDLQCKQVAEAVELPNHGNLIDRDALCIKGGRNCGKMFFAELLKNAPVVIPAERRKNDLQSMGMS